MKNKHKYMRRSMRPSQFITLVPKGLSVSLPRFTLSDVIHTDVNTAVMESERSPLYMIVAGDDQTPCKWNGRQLVIEWIDDNGLPLFTKEQATYVINCTYKFFESVGRTAHPVLKTVPVFQIQTI